MNLARLLTSGLRVGNGQARRAKSPAIISIVSPKGGVGKSTLCVNMAFMLRKQGFSVAIIDGDPQESILLWKELRDSYPSNDLDGIAISAVNLDRSPISQITEFSADFALIDTPGYRAPEISSLLQRSTLTIIPSKISALDLRANFPTVNYLRANQRNYFMIFTMVAGDQEKVFGSFRKDLERDGFIVAPLYVPHDPELVDSFARGMFHAEYRPESKTSKEFEWLVKYATMFL